MELLIFALMLALAVTLAVNEQLAIRDKRKSK